MMRHILEFVCVGILSAVPCHAARALVPAGVEARLNKMESSPLQSYRMTFPSSASGKALDLGRALGTALERDESGDTERWRSPDGIHRLTYRQAAGVARYRRKVTAASLESRDKFPFGLNARAEELCSLLVGVQRPEYRFERMYANVLSEPGLAPRVTSRRYVYRRIIDGMAVLDEAGAFTVTFDRNGTVLAVELPMGEVSAGRKIRRKESVLEHVENAVSRTKAVEEHGSMVTVGEGTLVAVAPALHRRVVGGENVLAPIVCVKVDYGVADGRILRREHFVPYQD